jgi:hypothetical protein
VNPWKTTYHLDFLHHSSLSTQDSSGPVYYPRCVSRSILLKHGVLNPETMSLLFSTIAPCCAHSSPSLALRCRDFLLMLLIKRQKGKAVVHTSQIQRLHQFLSALTGTNHLYPSGFKEPWTNLSCWESAKSCGCDSTPNHFGSRREDS